MAFYMNMMALDEAKNVAEYQREKRQREIENEDRYDKQIFGRRKTGENYKIDTSKIDNTSARDMFDSHKSEKMQDQYEKNKKRKEIAKTMVDKHNTGSTNYNLDFSKKNDYAIDAADRNMRRHPENQDKYMKQMAPDGRDLKKIAGDMRDDIKNIKDAKKRGELRPGEAYDKITDARDNATKKYMDKSAEIMNYKRKFPEAYDKKGRAKHECGIFAECYFLDEE